MYRLTDFNFVNTFNMGYEGFSKPHAPARMHPVTGNRGEFIFLFFFIITTPLLMRGRKSNETSLREMNK